MNLTLGIRQFEFDPDNFIDAVFNYGAFDFNTPNFVPKFAKGDLEYFAVAHSILIL
jgi:hypothetical protein